MLANSYTLSEAIPVKRTETGCCIDSALKHRRRGDRPENLYA
jgi:hypothetical protein